MTEFDRYATDYEALRAENVRWFGYPPNYFDEYKIRLVFTELARERPPDEPLAVLNFGCGVGKSDVFITRYFPSAEVLGVDVSVESIEIARRVNRTLPRVSYRTIEDSAPLRLDRLFDMIFVANVFHHVEPSRHVPVLRDLFRHLRPGGSVFFFEHNPHNPLTRYAVNRCPMDINATLLKPSYAAAAFLVNV